MLFLAWSLLEECLEIRMRVGLLDKLVAGTVNLISGIKDWIVDNAESIPIVGQLIKAVKAFKKKDWKEGLIQLGRMINPVAWIVDLFSGDEEGPSIGERAVNFIKGITDWVKEKIYDVPILGDIARRFRTFSYRPNCCIKSNGSKDSRY